MYTPSPRIHSVMSRFERHVSKFFRGLCLRPPYWERAYHPIARSIKLPILLTGGSRACFTVVSHRIGRSTAPHRTATPCRAGPEPVRQAARYEAFCSQSVTHRRARGSRLDLATLDRRRVESAAVCDRWIGVFNARAPTDRRRRRRR